MQLISDYSNQVYGQLLEYGFIQDASPCKDRLGLLASLVTSPLQG